MTPEKELEMQKKRDEAYINAANPVWKGGPKNFMRGYLAIQPLYDGTSFQKEYYPKHYDNYLKSIS